MKSIVTHFTNWVCHPSDFAMPDERGPTASVADMLVIASTIIGLLAGFGLLIWMSRAYWLPLFGG